MTSLFHISLLFFATTSRCLSLDDALLQKYVSLITDVRRHYGAPSVFFLFSSSNRDLQEYTSVHFLSRDLSRKGILSLIVNFEELEERTSFYREQIVRPLIVVFLKAMSDVAEFHEYTRKMSTAYPRWLMMFGGKVGDSLCRYCGNPEGNVLRLRYDTEMVVVCCDDPIIKEWWSLSEDRTETADLATWKKNEGLKLLVPRGVYSRRNDVRGVGIRIATVGRSWAGRSTETLSNFYFGNVVLELKRAMNFTITAETPVPAFGNLYAATSNWTGIIGHLAQKETDLGVAEFTMTNSRRNVIDFTLPLLLTRTQLYIKQPDGAGVQWSAYVQAFTLEIWITIIVLLVASTALLTVIQVIGNEVPTVSLLSESCLSVWGLFCQQGLFKFPAETPLRIAFFSILVSAVVVFTAYSASLTSYLTVSSATLPFSTLSGFVEDGSYKLIVIQNSSNYDLFMTSNDATLKKMSDMMKPMDELPKTFKEGFRQVCKEKVAFYTNSAVKSVINRYISCKVVSIETERVDSLAMATDTGNQYNGVVNYHLQRFQDNGILNRLKQKYITTENLETTTYHVVTLWGVAPVLSVLAGGMILAAVLLLLEIMCLPMKKCAQRWKHTMCPRNSKLERLFNDRDKKTTGIVDIRKNNFVKSERNFSLNISNCLNK